jgi:hypothetical protein
MPTKSKEYAARYSVPVSPSCEAMIAAEVKYQEEQKVGGFKTPKGQFLGELIEEAVRSRMKARGIEPSQMPAVKPEDAATPAPVSGECNCGADRTGPSAEAHAEGCPAK